MTEDDFKYRQGRSKYRVEFTCMLCYNITFILI